MFPLHKRVSLVLGWLLQGQTIEFEFCGRQQVVGMSEDYKIVFEMRRERRIDGEKKIDTVYMGHDIKVGELLNIVEKMPTERFVELAANAALNKIKGR